MLRFIMVLLISFCLMTACEYLDYNDFSHTRMEKPAHSKKFIKGFSRNGRERMFKK